MPKVTVNSIGEYIREQREQAKISMRQLAQSAGVSNPYLSQIERGLRKPSADILQQIAKGLRISAEALYVQAGILEDRAPDSGVRSALLADPQLSERQKQVLLEIYESFRRENANEAAASAPAGLDAGAPGSEGAALEAEAEAAEAAAWQAAAAEAAEEAAQAEAAEAAAQAEAAQAEAVQAEAVQAAAVQAAAAQAAAAESQAATARAAAEPSAPAAGPTLDPADVSPIRPTSASD